MGRESKVKKLLTTSRGPSEVEDWLFTLTPLGVAFAFYMIFIMSTNVEPKGLFMAGGAAAGIVGLESYWIFRGWRKNHASTIILGFIGIAITLALFSLYASVV
jgi:hypothetical protein